MTPGGRDDWRFWWRAWAADQSSTRIQMTTAIMLVFIAAAVKTMTLIRTVAEGVTVLQVLIPIVTIAAGWHLGGKGLEILKERTTNGNGVKK